ncbi:hypothetical protein BD311DRAFT_465427 [Dichomitus squalens]|uniref:Uncharacterized protein n=1 Tax=Dichomitus squalens TaxID=114155 RepID=A0A4Q9MJ31_9APHY|nr:hypothetical protein BD311DRAFT_465427 [Dichomitus squalens]
MSSRYVRSCSDTAMEDASSMGLGASLQQFLPSQKILLSQNSQVWCSPQRHLLPRSDIHVLHEPIFATTGGLGLMELRGIEATREPLLSVHDLASCILPLDIGISPFFHLPAGHPVPALPFTIIPSWTTQGRPNGLPNSACGGARTHAPPGSWHSRPSGPTPRCMQRM